MLPWLVQALLPSCAHLWTPLGPCADLCCTFSFSVILWLGDLNYRLEELDVVKVKQLIDEKAFLELCQYDQVLMSLLPEVVLKVLLHHTPWPAQC